MDIVSTPLFGITLTLLAYVVSVYIYTKSKGPLLNPMLISTLIIIAILLISKIDYSNYKIGGDYISFFLGPSTVVLAVPLYKTIDLLRKNLIPILVGISAGSFVGISCIILFSKLLGLDISIIKSLAPKSVTTPIGIEVAKSLGGIESITVIAIVITGITGAIIAPYVLKLFRINDPLSKGVSIGTSSHALGTTKAMEIGEVEGAMSSLSIGIAGLITLVLAPLLISLIL